MTTKSVPSEQVAREWLRENHPDYSGASLAALLERTRDEALENVTRFEISDEISVERRAKGWHYAKGLGKVEDGKELWAITRRSCVLAKDGLWEFEPTPSERDAEYLERTRWTNRDECRAAAIRAAKKEEKK
jgi:hypothetical protein